MGPFIYLPTCGPPTDDRHLTVPHPDTPTHPDTPGPHYESLWTVDGKVASPKIGHDMGLVAMNAAVALGASLAKAMNDQLITC